MSFFKRLFSKVLKPIARTILPGGTKQVLDLAAGIFKRSKRGKQIAQVFNRPDPVIVNRRQREQSGSSTVQSGGSTRTSSQRRDRT